MTPQEAMQLLQMVYNAARAAPLPADVHDQLRDAAQKLAAYILPPAQTEPPPAQ